MGKKAEFFDMLMFGDPHEVAPASESLSESLAQNYGSILRTALPFMIIGFLVTGSLGMAGEYASNLFFVITGCVIGVPYAAFAFYIWAKVSSQ